MRNDIILINKDVADKVGIESAYFLTVVDKAVKTTEVGQKTGWAQLTSKEVEDETGLSRYKQDSILQELIELEILEKKLIGVPAKRHIRFV